MTSKANIKRSPRLMVLALAVALLALGACVPSEDEFKEEHPFAVDEGSVFSPLDLGQTPISRSSSVGPGGSSFYVLNPTFGTVTYTISSLTGDADLFVYSNSTFSGLLCKSTNGGTATDSCSASCGFALCVVYVKVADFVSSDGGATFNLGVTVF